MKQLNIPFKLGMQYDNWEFDLDVTNDRIQGCDSYIYIGKKFNKFLNYSTDKTELIFSLDILDAVVLAFTNRNISFYYELIKIINASSKQKINYQNSYLAYLKTNNLIRVKYNSLTREVTLFYGKNRFIPKHLLLLQKN